MSVHSPRRMGRPPMTPPDAAVERALIEQLRRADERIRDATRERSELALAANEAGLTTARIGQAIGASAGTVSNWVRQARGLRAAQDSLDESTSD